MKTIFERTEEIPEKWNFLKISELGKIVGGGTPDTKEEEYWKNGTKSWFTPQELTNLKTNFVNESERKITKKGLQNSSAKELPKGTILVTTRATIGNCAIAGNAVSTNQGFQNLICKKEIDNQFVRYSIIHNKNRLMQYAQGTTFLEISKTNFSKIKIPIPENIKESEKIANILSNLDNLIVEQTEIIEYEKDLKKGLLKKLFSEGINGEKHHEMELGRKFIKSDIPDSWKLRKLHKDATVHGRIGWKNLRADEYVESGPLMLSVWSLNKKNIYGIDNTKGVHRLSQFRYEESPEIQLKVGDVLVAKDGDIGRLGYVDKLDEPTTVNSHVVVVRIFSEDIDPEFLYYYFQHESFQKYCVAFTSRTTVPLLSQVNLKDIPIPIPDWDEQQEIKSIIKNNSELIFGEIQYLEKLKKIRKGLMQQLLTGQKRVKV